MMMVLGFHIITAKIAFFLTVQIKTRHIITHYAFWPFRVVKFPMGWENINQKYRWR